MFDDLSLDYRERIAINYAESLVELWPDAQHELTLAYVASANDFLQYLVDAFNDEFKDPMDFHHAINTPGLVTDRGDRVFVFSLLRYLLKTEKVQIPTRELRSWGPFLEKFSMPKLEPK